MYSSIGVFDIGQKGHFFKKEPQKFDPPPHTPPPLFNPFSKLLEVLCIKMKLCIFFSKGRTVQLSNAI